MYGLSKHRRHTHSYSRIDRKGLVIEMGVFIELVLVGFSMRNKC